MEDYKAIVMALSDQQCLSILDSLAAEFGSDQFPENVEKQVEILQRVFDETSCEASVAPVAEANTQQAVHMARGLLLMMAEVPAFQASLESRLRRPPSQETAGLPLLLLAPVVLTGCLTFIYVVGHVRMGRKSDGSWWIDYDPAMDTALGRSFKDVIAAIAGVIRQ